MAKPIGKTYRISFEVFDAENNNAHVEQYLEQKQSNGKWKRVKLSDCDSFGTFLIYQGLDREARPEHTPEFINCAALISGLVLEPVIDEFKAAGITPPRAGSGAEMLTAFSQHPDLFRKAVQGVLDDVERCHKMNDIPLVSTVLKVWASGEYDGVKNWLTLLFIAVESPLGAQILSDLNKNIFIKRDEAQESMFADMTSKTDVSQGEYTDKKN